MRITTRLFNFYYNNYKKLLIIPILFLIFNLSVIFYTWINIGSPVYLDSSIKGGAVFTFKYNGTIDISALEQSIQTSLNSNDVSVVLIRSALSNDILGYEIHVDETITEEDVRLSVEQYLNVQLDNSMISFTRQSSNLGSSFLSQSLTLIAIGFLFVTIVSYLSLKKNIIPSLTTLISTILDVIGIIAFLDLFQIRFSVGTIGALLMIIGYSADSDILLATNILKSEPEKLKENTKNAMITIFTMNFTALSTYLIMLLLSNVEIIKHIATILLLGIFYDALDSWLGARGVIQRMYAEKKK
ncbi:Protein-export membrane protein SecF [Candidatus Tiddalikarchaeum anstoanum]|nr:Protein-export membrane protein SecF [Candidatus Tiddalikarchaeum anstoanum]